MGLFLGIPSVFKSLEKKYEIILFLQLLLSWVSLTQIKQKGKIIILSTVIKTRQNSWYVCIHICLIIGFWGWFLQLLKPVKLSNRQNWLNLSVAKTEILHHNISSLLILPCRGVKLVNLSEGVCVLSNSWPYSVPKHNIKMKNQSTLD